MADLTAIKTANDVAELLDVNLTGLVEWYAGVKSHKFFRVVGFGEHYRLLDSARKGSRPLRTDFIDQAIEVAKQLSQAADDDWCESGFGPDQLTAALNGQAMRFDRAVVVVLTLNKMIDHAQADTPKLGTAVIATCAFRFEMDLADLIHRAAGDCIEHVKNGGQVITEEKARAFVATRLAKAAGQHTSLVRELARTDRTETSKKLATASYRTCRAMYKALMLYPSCKAEFPEDRMNIIHPRKQGQPNMEADPNEILLLPARVTRPPYHWALEAGEEGAYPPDIDASFAPFDGLEQG